MAITYPLAMPSTPGWTAFKWRAVSVIGLAASPFTGQQQVAKFQGEVLQAECELPSMARAEAEAWVAFMLALRGRYGTFKMGDPAGKAPRGTASSATATGSAGAETVTLTFSNTLLKGDWIQVGSSTTQRIYKLLEDAATGTPVTIYPRLREALSSATVTLTNTTGVFRLISNTVEWDLDTIKRFGIGFSAMEAF